MNYRLLFSLVPFICSITVQAATEDPRINCFKKALPLIAKSYADDTHSGIAEEAAKLCQGATSDAPAKCYEVAFTQIPQFRVNKDAALKLCSAYIFYNRVE